MQKKIRNKITRKLYRNSFNGFLYCHYVRRVIFIVMIWVMPWPRKRRNLTALAFPAFSLKLHSRAKRPQPYFKAPNV